MQARRAVPPQHEGQEPRAEAAVRVVEDGPAAFAGRAGRAPFVSVACHVDTSNAKFGNVTRACYGLPDQAGRSGLPTFQITMLPRKIVT